MGRKVGDSPWNIEEGTQEYELKTLELRVAFNGCFRFIFYIIIKNINYDTITILRYYELKIVIFHVISKCDIIIATTLATQTHDLKF